MSTAAQRRAVQLQIERIQYEKISQMLARAVLNWMVEDAKDKIEMMTVRAMRLVDEVLRG